MSFRDRVWTGDEFISRAMADVLTRLNEAKKRGDVFVALELTPDGKRSMRALVKRDWVFESAGLDGVRYTITGRGQRVIHKICQVKRYRRDGLCPRCGDNERKRDSSYCAPCCNELYRQRYAPRARKLLKAKRLQRIWPNDGGQNVSYRKGQSS